MILVNETYCKLSQSYLFSEVAKRIGLFKKRNPNIEIIKMGIGDTTLPICNSAIKAMHHAVDEMGDTDTYHGYGPEQGYLFLRECIATYDYKSRGIDICIDEIFVSDGAKSDIGNIGDILSSSCKVAITDPVYPVYIDTSVMAGRAGEIDCMQQWDNIEYLPCNSTNNFIPDLPKDNPNIIYLCYPNNPTGTTLTKKELAKWVDYAIRNNALILFDSAYEAFITEDDIPHSIYEVDRAKECAIEFRSYSKSAGFTGLRCGYTIVPRELQGVNKRGESIQLNSLWNRRQATKFNGVSYVTQRGAEALYTKNGIEQRKDAINYYMRNAKILREGCKEVGFEVFGGVNAPYIWIKAPDKMKSWSFFDVLLQNYHIAGTPGVGFGLSGEGYLRLTAFGKYQDTVEAVKRLQKIKKTII